MIPQNGNVRGVWEEQAEAAKEYVGSSSTVFFLQVLIETSEQLSIHTTGKSASKCKGPKRAKILLYTAVRSRNFRLFYSGGPVSLPPPPSPPPPLPPY